MNGYIREYLKQVKLFFPIVGKPERLYLKRLAGSIEDYFQEHDPKSVGEVVQVFDRPQEAVRKYLSSTEVECVVKRVRNRRLAQTAVCTIICVVLMATMTFGVGLGIDYKALRETQDYLYPVYSGETGELLGYEDNDGVFYELD